MKCVPLLFLSLGMLSGCGLQESNSEQEQGESNAASEISGYVVDENDEEVLVVDTEASSTANDGEHYDAVWLSDFSEDVELGEKVNAEYGDAMEPYPGETSDVAYIEVIEEERPEDADLTDAEVLREILPVDELDVPVIKTLEHDAEANQWTIEMADGVELMGGDMDAETIDFEIDDE
ncbi:DUF3221 domain-containing protein [Salicibibacter cibarius]|uniref:DUF3221 domain-containing protein n=1 Tax=Salicibibacter cibarius TaxID=2743000 RepID=A0A7T6Z1E6_9BACI|nr:DUF3221 domain-containing protein [Salicibibacter cibarius]QQK74892.1 DUF3221 domain-containing protein [Salicibibacter cibarius]